MKTCTVCDEDKELSEFYKHSECVDGHSGKCKVCTKLASKVNRASKAEHYREYDKARGSRNDRDFFVKLRDAKPNQYAAHIKLNNAIRSGEVVRLPCEVCGGLEVHAHHSDYNKPLDVIWLCPVHHAEWHDDHGPAINP